MNKKIFSGICISALVILGIVVFNMNDAKENNNISASSVSEQTVGSKMPGTEISFDWEQFKNVKHMIEFGTKLVIVGTVTNDGETIEEDAPTTIPGAPAVKFHRSLYNIYIDSVLYGDYSSDSITFEQMGSVGSDLGETKVHKGDKLLLFLEKNKYGYSAMGQEQGIYVLDRNGKIKTITDNKDLKSLYENKEINEIEKEIKSILKEKKN